MNRPFPRARRASAAALLFAAALLLLSAFLLRPAAAHAEEGEALPSYARVTRSDTWLYEAADEDTGLFVLPETYFVRITGQANGFYAVTYLSDTPGRTPVSGWCRADAVTAVDYIPETPFLYYEVDVTYSAGEGLPDGFLTDYTVTAAYYGTFAYGSSPYYYVELEGMFGYVPAAACSALDYPPNTEHTETETTGPAGGEEPSSGCATANIVLVCALSVAALGAVYFLFRPAVRRERRPEDAEEY